MFRPRAKPYKCGFSSRRKNITVLSNLTYVAGANLDGTRTRKDQVIACALRGCGVEAPAAAVMVGDREYDIWGARKQGLDSIGVLYGYGGQTELQTAGATHLAARPGDIFSFVTKN